MAKKRVLIICPFYPPNLGGVETHLQLLTDYLSRHRYPTTVLTYRPLTTTVASYLSYEKRKNLEIHRFWWPSGKWFDQTTPYPFLQFLYVVPSLLVNSLIFMAKNHQRFEVIHAHGFAAAFILRIIDLFFPGKKKVVSTHFIYKRLDPESIYGRVFRWVFSGFDQILLIGRESGRELAALGLKKEKMRVFHHWLDQKKFSPARQLPCRKKLNLPPKAKLLVLFIGRLLRMKGIFNLVEAAKSLPKDIFFVLVGDGPDAGELKKAAKGVANFILVGKKTHEKTIDFYGAADLLILPSLAEEAQPLVVLEALSCGRPVITTDRGAVKEMFNSRVGLVIDPTVANITRVLLNFYHHPKILYLMGQEARRFALKKYGPRNATIITRSYQ